MSGNFYPQGDPFLLRFITSPPLAKGDGKASVDTNGGNDSDNHRSECYDEYHDNYPNEYHSDYISADCNDEFAKTATPGTKAHKQQPPPGKPTLFFDGFQAPLHSPIEFGMDYSPVSPVYRHFYARENSDLPDDAQIPEEIGTNGPTEVPETTVAVHNPAYEQAQLLLVSLLENFCALYDRNPDKNRRLFMAVCRQLWNMGILSSEDFFNRSEKLRSVYKEAFRTLVLQAIQGIEANDTENRFLAEDEFQDFEHSENDSDLGKSVSGYSSHNSSSMSGTFEIKPMRSRLETEFRDLVPIGRGGFAQVFRGEHRIDHCEYAFKRIEFKSKTSESYEKIIREIKSLAHLEHPNIVRYHGAWIEERTVAACNRSKSVDDTDTEAFTSLGINGAGISIPVYNDAQQFEKEDSLGYYMIIQMELCQFTLADWLEQRNFLICHSKPWKPEYSTRHWKSRLCIPVDCMASLVGAQTWDINQTENNRIFKCIVKALQHIHAKGIIHRDLKPGNILFQVDEDIFIPKIGDFGLAADMAITHDLQLSEDSTPTRIDSFIKSTSPSTSKSTRTTGLGTCNYAAPEQIRGDDVGYNEKVDIFSLGIILFELYYPFATRMERQNVLEDLKKGVIPASFMKRWPKEATFIWSCISESADTRPSAEQIFESEIFEQDPDETVERLCKENSTLKRLLEVERERVRLLEANLAEAVEKVKKLQNEVIEEVSLEIKHLNINTSRLNVGD